jgi:aspartokinase
VALVSVVSASHGGSLAPKSVFALGKAQIHPIVISRAIVGSYLSFVVPDDEVITAVRVLHDELQFGNEG